MTNEMTDIVERLTPYDCDGDPCGTFDHAKFFRADEVKAAITALRADLDEVLRERDEAQRTYDDLYADALADAKSDAQDFDGDLWIEVRKLLTELELDWRDYQDDGIPADQAVDYIRECMDAETHRAETAEAALRSQRAEVLREAAGVADHFRDQCGECLWPEDAVIAASDTANEIGRSILALIDAPKERG